MQWQEFRKLEWLVILILGAGLGWILVEMYQAPIERWIINLLE